MMTKEQIEAVFDRVRTWPLERQEDARGDAAQDGTCRTVALDELVGGGLRVEIEAALAEADRGGTRRRTRRFEPVFDRYRRP